MKILLDSNIYIRDLAFQSEGIRDLFVVTSSSMSLLCIPQLVLDEVRAHQQQALLLHEEELRKVTRKIRNVSGYIAPTPQNVAAAGRSSFESTLEALCRESWAHILDYPAASHRDIVERELLGLKPFNRERHTGYRDYLLWLSVLGECLSPMEPVVFITENIKDFGEGKLHADLQRDLQASGIAEGHLIYLNSLSAFNKRFMPVVATLPNVDTKEMEPLVRAWLADKLRSAVRDEEIIAVCLDRETREAHQVVSFDVETMDVREGHVYPSGELQIPVLVKVGVGFVHRDSRACSNSELSLTIMVLATRDRQPLRCVARRVEGDHGMHACMVTHWDSRGLFLDWVEHSLTESPPPSAHE